MYDIQGPVFTYEKDYKKEKADRWVEPFLEKIPKQNCY